jgi:hypothetical protein
MRLSLPLAKKLIILKTEGSLIASQLSQSIASDLVSDGILIRQSQGRTKATWLLKEPALLESYLRNKYDITDLAKYISGLENKDLTGKQGIEIANNTKIRRTRHFKGFLVNSYLSFTYTLNGRTNVFNPFEGSFLYIHDFESFTVPNEYTLVGIENPENFRYVELQKHLLADKLPIFFSRYPQSNDLVNWMQHVCNPYLHFGDFDFAGLLIYLNEFKKHLSNRAHLFIPPDLSTLINRFGNRDLYNNQLHLRANILTCNDVEVLEIMELLDIEKKGLEQEALIL